MPIVVLKFGGSSLATRKQRQQAAELVLAAFQAGQRPVAVVSAPGRKGAPYATDTLLALLNEAGPLSPRDVDLVMSCGEIIAAGMLAAELSRHLKAVIFTGTQAGIITDAATGDARILRVEPERLRLSLSKDEVPVIAGFQGMSTHGEITTLGRGGSDTSAAAIGVALKAERVEIYTDVPGIMTADPALVPEARLLPLLAYQEMLHLAHEGAQVMHYRAVEMAMQNNLPLVVRQLQGGGEGTVIASVTSYETERAEPVIGVTYRKGLAQISLTGADLDKGFDCRLFAALAKASISVDLINISPAGKAFVVPLSRLPQAKELVSSLGAEFRVRNACSKVSVIGVGMRGTSGVMATLCRALYDANVSILQTGDSPLAISCLVEEEQLAAAVKSLHKHFSLHEVGIPGITNKA